MQTDSNVVSTLISSEQISEIATENRNFAALAALGLGVSSALPDSNTPTSVAANFTLSINGLRQSHNIWLIDGGEADDRGGAGGMDIMPSQDAIAEFNVLTSNYPPDYGISSGATMSLSLKSGTQKFHGEAWEFNRNTDYDANSYFNKPRAGSARACQPTTTSSASTSAGRSTFRTCTTPTSRGPSSSATKNGARSSQRYGTNVEHTIDPADIPKSGQNLTYMAPAFAPGNTLVVPEHLHQQLLLDAHHCSAGRCVPAQPEVAERSHPGVSVRHQRHPVPQLAGIPGGQPEPRSSDQNITNVIEPD